MALSSAVQEAVWVRGILKEINMCHNEPVLIYQDNQGCISMAKNPSHHSRSKHIDIKYHFVREKVDNKEIKIRYCPTERMVADILTKPLLQSQHVKLRLMLGLNEGFVEGEC